MVMTESELTRYKCNRRPHLEHVALRERQPTGAQKLPEHLGIRFSAEGILGHIPRPNQVPSSLI
jgi:hypothetical protein